MEYFCHGEMTLMLVIIRHEYYQKFIKVWFIKSQKWKIKIKNSASYLGYKAGYGRCVWYRVVVQLTLAIGHKIGASLLIIEHKIGVLLWIGHKSS